MIPELTFASPAFTMMERPIHRLRPCGPQRIGR